MRGRCRSGLPWDEPRQPNFAAVVVGRNPRPSLVPVTAEVPEMTDIGCRSVMCRFHRAVRDSWRGTCFRVLLVQLALLSCRGSGTEPPRVASLRIVAGGSVTDTVESRQLGALTIEARGLDGEVLVGTVVRFEVLPHADTTRREEQSMTLTPLDGASFSSLLVDSTGSDGRAHALVGFGTVAGPAHVLINVPELALSDTARFTVTPGTPTRIEPEPRDTALGEGRQYALRTLTRDRFGNARTDAATFSSASSGCAVESNRVTGITVSRCAIVARSGNAVDTVHVNVVPNIRVVAVSVPLGKGATIVSMDLDGSACVHGVSADVVV
jgi:hypothetical protein